MATLKNIKDYLPQVFILKDKDTPTERLVFNSEFMDKNNLGTPLDETKHAIYQAISEAQRKSNLSFNFSYEIANKAVDILSDLEDWNDDDAITEGVDSSVPVYTNQVMEIYKSDSWAVDEAVNNIGGSGADSEQRAKYGWYEQIQQMAEAIKANLLELVDENETNEAVKVQQGELEAKIRCEHIWIDQITGDEEATEGCEKCLETRAKPDYCDICKKPEDADGNCGCTNPDSLG